VLAELCPAEDLNYQQQQQQQQQHNTAVSQSGAQQQQQNLAVDYSGTQLLSACVLDLVTRFLAMRINLLCLPAWRPLLLPAARLAVRMLQAWPADSLQPPSSSSSSSNDSRHGSRSSSRLSSAGPADAPQDHKQYALDCVCQSARALQTSFRELMFASRESAKAIEQLAADDVTGAASLIRLLYIPLAWGVAALKKKLGGKSPVSLEAITKVKASSSSGSSSRRRQQQQQGLEVPAYHEQYLAAVGAPFMHLEAEDVKDTLHGSFVLCLLPGAAQQGIITAFRTEHWRLLLRVQHQPAVHRAAVPTRGLGASWSWCSLVLSSCCC
jgi:hypothetical protein